MSVGDSALLQEWATPRNLYTGGQVPTQRLDFNFSDAGFGGAFSSPLVPMLLQPMINTFFGQGGIMPAQFAPMQGLADQVRAKQFYQARMTAMTTASSADRETYVRMIRGMAEMRGTPWGLEQQRSANVMASDAAFMAPFMAQAMPEMFDEIHGSRGSATVMASFLHKGGLTGVDPVTGRTGITGTSAGVLAAEMHKRFFGGDADLAGWRGMRAGAAGALYDEMQNRGLMGPSIGIMTDAEQREALTGSATSRQDAMRMLRERDPAQFAKITGEAAGTGDEQIRRLAEAKGVAKSALANLEETEPAEFQGLLRQFDATRIGNRLKGMSGAVAAMREIFGDMGKPNAPMTELIRGLDSLTQGGLATMNPAELERTVRSTQVIARTSGIGMAGLTGMMTQGAAQAAAMGLDARFGVTSAQGAAEFGAAYGQAGRGDIAGWGRVDREKMTLMDQQLRLNAAASPMANRLAGLMRVVETQEAAGNEVTGPLASAAAAIREHRMTFTNELGEEESLSNIKEPRWYQLMEKSNINRANAWAILKATKGNQEQLDRYDITDLTKQAQPEEFKAMMADSFHGSVLNTLNAAGVGDPRDRGEIARIASRAQAEALAKMDPTIRTSDATRNQAMIDATREAVEAKFVSQGLTAAEATTKFDRMFPQEQLSVMISAGVGQAQQRLADDPRLKGFPSLYAGLDAMNPKVEARRQVLRQENAAQVALGTALGGVGSTPWLARLMDEVQKPSGSISEAVQKVLGGIPVEKIREQIAAINPEDLDKRAGVGAQERMTVLSAELLETTKQYDLDKDDTTKTPEEKTKLTQEYAARINALMGRSSADAQLKTELVKGGLITGDADAATVEAMATRVQQGDKTLTLPEGLRNRVIALRAAGASIDAKALRRQQESVLASMGFKPEEFNKALSGKLDEDERMKGAGVQKLRTLQTMRGGMATAAAEAGMAMGAQVSEKELTGAANQAEYLRTMAAKELPKKGPERDKAVAELKRRAENVIERDTRLSGVILGSEASVLALGPGGFAVAKEYRDKQQQMAEIAEDAGLNLADVLSGTAKLDTSAKQEAAKKIQALRGDVDKARADLAKRSGIDPKDRVALSDAEKKQTQTDYAAYAATQVETDEQQNKKLIESIAGTMGTAAKGDVAGQAQAVTDLGKGPESASSRRALSRAFDARKQLQEMAKERKISVKELRDTGGADTAKLFESAGDLADDDTFSSVHSTIKQIKEREAKAAEAKKQESAVPSKMAMSGSVTLKRDGTLDMSGATGAMGSTPVAGAPV